MRTVYDFGYCPVWPDNLKELGRVYYRAQCRVRNLEAYIERVDPDDFETVMHELEQAKSELFDAAIAFEAAKRNWYFERDPLTLNGSTRV